MEQMVINGSSVFIGVGAASGVVFARLDGQLLGEFDTSDEAMRAVVQAIKQRHARSLTPTAA